MGLFLILALTVALYVRSLDYHYVIDDIVKRDGYLYIVPETGPSRDFWETKPSRWYRAFMILTHCVNVTVIYVLWGWAPALLFAVHPIGVVGTVWVTGNYYATTALFCLASFYFLHVYPGILSALASMAFMTAALNSTVTALAFPILTSVVCWPWGLVNIFPLVMFLRGKRWNTGIKIRENLASNRPVDCRFTWRRLLLMTKVMARYIFLALYPNKLGFFRMFGQGISAYQDRYDRIHSANGEFWGSLLLCGAVFGVGLTINPVATIWFFILMGLHSQWQLLGQFFAERYLYLPIIGLCVIFGTALQEYPLVIAVLATLLAVRTCIYMPYWRHQRYLWENDKDNFPEYYATWNNAAQFLISGGKIPPEDVNQAAAWLYRAQNMNPNAWEVHMNVACFNYLIGQTELALHHTNRSIECLKPMGGVAGPMKVLLKQKEDIEKILKVSAKEARLGESLSPPQQTKEEENGKIETETTSAGDPECDRERDVAVAEA